MERPPQLQAADADGQRLSDVQLFREDVVQSLSHPERIGMVTRVGGDSSDSDSSGSDEEDEDEEEQEERNLSEGSARIVWIDSQQSTEKVTDIRVVDRAFMHGDVLALASDPLGQTGTVIEVDMFVDLELLNKEILRGIDSRHLRRVRGFTPGDYVIHGHWLGRVEEVLDNVTVLFEDGSKCKVQQAEPSRLIPNSESLMDDTESPYYPGQRVRASSSGIFKSAKWIRGTWKASRMEGTVVDVEAGTVIVYWIAVSAMHSSAVPAEQQDARDLVSMTYFTHTNWQIGDRALLPDGFRVPAGEAGGILETGSDLGILDVIKAEPMVSGSQIETGVEGTAPGPSGSMDISTADTADSASVQRQRRPSKQQLRRTLKKERKASRKEKNAESATLIVNTRTMVDVLWQDGTKTSKVSACSLVPVDHLGDHDFWPEQYVLEQGSAGDDTDNEVRRVGILKSIDAKQRTAVVRWLKPVARPEELREFGEEETVSVYELVEHPDYAYCLGDVVIRLSPGPSVDSDTRPEESEPFSSVEDTVEHKPNALGMDPEWSSRSQTVKMETEGHTEEPLDLSWVGIIIGLQNGDIEVAWANGMISKVGPQAIFVVTRDGDDMSSTHSSDLEEDDEEDNDGDDAASWETVNSSDECAREAELDMDSDHSEREGGNDRRNVSRPSKVHGEDDPDQLITPRYRGPIAAAIGLVSRMATGLLAFRGINREAANNRNGQVCASAKHGLEEILDGDEAGRSRELCHVVDRRRRLDPTSPGAAKDELVERNTSGELEELKLGTRSSDPGAVKEEVDVWAPSSKQDELKNGTGTEELCSSPCSKSEIDVSVDQGTQVEGASASKSQPQTIALAHIKHFDIVSDQSDHHYNGETAQSSSQRRWAKKIQSEWSSLEKNLPDTIYVRVYEERMDLLRAVILGAPGTPYHDGLFVFDLYLPPEYPHTPPLAYYHSGGLRLNPNLYESGKVCLSLLNTWTGRGTEVWDPSTSSILQVLVSIQGLVLNAKPYFNEAGYDRQSGTLEGEKNSVVYNENSFLLSCKSMLYLLRRPPMHFEDLIRLNFVQKGAGLLQSCEAYMQGAPVGSLVENKNTSTLADTELVGGDKSSAGFKLMLVKLVVKLKEAFKELGVDCDDSS